METGEERLRWQLDEIVWAEQAGDAQQMLSDHAAVCYVRTCRAEADRGEGRPRHDIKAWRLCPCTTPLRLIA